MSGPGSGINIPDECVTAYNALQKEKVQRCIIYKIHDDKTHVEIDKTFDKGEDDQTDFEDIVSTLVEDQPRFLVFDIKGPPAKTGALGNDRVVFLSWISDNAGVKQKMLYSSSVNSLKSKFKGVYKYITVNDKCDLSFSKVLAEL